MKKNLSSAEWSLLAFFFIVFASLVLIAKVNVYRAEAAIAQFSQDEFLVNVSGEVKKPGQYWVSSGETVGSVIAKAKPKRFADLDLSILKETVVGPRVIVVPQLKEIRVTIEGEVEEPITLFMPVGSRISDLKSKIKFTNEADSRFFRRKKLLHNGEKIRVPKKGVE